MGRKANPALIGAFVIGALALAVIGVVVLGSGRFFRETVQCVVYIDSTKNGLHVGAPVVQGRGDRCGEQDRAQPVRTSARAAR
jgi:paraquat-inducible protein B